MPAMNDLLIRLDERLRPAADPTRAAGMAAYMKNQFEFLGLPAPVLQKLAKAAQTGLPRPTPEELRTIALELWSRPQREYQYVACSYLVRHVDVPGADFITTVRTLVTTKSWWDTIDPLATRFTGGLVKRHRALVDAMDEWSRDDNMWLVRVAILHQLHYGADTDEERLFAYCAAQAGHRDFFVRKAIGWALRHYARTAPHEVRTFVEAHRSVLSGLSIREATKHL
ncbi:DNA alkylation repair protein [Paractinoplanes lichenicola]|uniref:DNA alkylation repair protein n=1 Tax=Paractinoplanes lichenicola TaxID=2802976 RepID=A0ABS1VPR4_9ACTN|nr:DNA alkylation repair protein [Actinoplanes lichenicola]MBL7256717.1 DNA alkylation repair protein [Actinoplanes lichenicola]